MFYFDDFYGKKILKSTLLPNFDCFFTTRDFVLTCANRNDLEDAAKKNRGFLEEKLNGKVISAQQIHSDNISIVETSQYYYENTDALISNVKNSILLMNFADCVPIILYSPKDNIGSIVHAGWRGSAKKIVQKTVKKLYNDFRIQPEDIIALIGPAIGKCCFETGEDVFEQLVEDKSNTFLYEKKKNKYHVDLKLLNNYQLKNIGVTKIDICDYCTCCFSDIFFSYRKEKGVTARHSAIIKIKEDK